MIAYDACSKFFKNRKGKYTNKQIAEKLGLSRPSVIRTLCRLEKDGIVERTYKDTIVPIKSYVHKMSSLKIYTLFWSRKRK